MAVVKRNIRNNNPGNLRITADDWVGKIDNPNENEFVTFATPELGVRAMTKQLYTYQERDLYTVQQMIETWAPPTENDTNSYASRVAAAMGVDLNSRVDLRNNPDLTAKMINAMIIEEGGNEASEYFAGAVNSGISMANGTLDPNFDPEDTPPTDDAEQEDNQGEDPVEEAEAVEEERIQDTTRLTKLPIFQDNVLNRYESYTYNWTVYMIPPERAHKLDQNIDNGEYVVIAQSGVEAEIAINNVRTELVMNPAHHRDAFATTFSFEMIEPLGVTLITRLVEACERLGIRSFQEATYLLELKFKGWDSDGNPVDNIVGPYYYSTKIVGWQAAHRDGATFYNVEFINTGQEFDKHLHSAIAEEVIVSASTVGAFITAFVKRLNEIEDNKAVNSMSKLFGDEYALALDDEVSHWGGWQFGASSDEENQNANINVDGTGNLKFTFKAGTKIVDAIGTALLHTNEFRRLPVYNTIKSNKQAKANGEDGVADPVAIADLMAWYNIDSDIEYGFWDVLAGQYTKKIMLTIKQFVAPEIRHDPVSTKKLLGDRNLQTKRLNNIVQAELLRKRYDYTYTGLNTEVVDLDVSLNNTFYTIQALQHGRLEGRDDFFVGLEEQNLISLKDDLSNLKSKISKINQRIADIDATLERLGNMRPDEQIDAGISRQGLTKERNQKLIELKNTAESQPGLTDQILAEQLRLEEIKKQQGNQNRFVSMKERYITQSDIAFKKPEVEAFPNKFNQTKFKSLATGGSSEEDRPAAAMLGAVEQNYTAFADMLTQQLNIRGDPYWLGRPKNQKSLRNRQQHANYQRGGVCYFLNLQFPTYPDNDTGLMDLSERNFGIIGIYRVMTVTATFVDGAFFMELSSIRDIHSNMEALYEQLQENYYNTTKGLGL